MTDNSLDQLMDFNIVEEVAKRQEEKCAWYYLLLDLYEARNRLFNYKVEISVKNKEPLFGSISFLHEDLSRFDAFKCYTGDYGFVVPVKASRNRKVLRGEKKLRYK